MSVVRNLIIRAGADFSQLRRQMAQAQRDVQGFRNGINNALAGIGATMATIGIAQVAKDATKDAMSVEASVMQINRIMGTSANVFVDWANTQGRAFNMSKTNALRYGAIYSNLLSTFSSGTEDTKNKTIDLMKASAIVASGTGREMEDVMWRIRSGLLGNTEAIEDLGINVYVNMLKSTKAFRQFAGDKSWDQLDFQTQQLIRYYGIMEQANKKFGTEINKNTNSAMQNFASVLGDIKLRIGQAFLPILNIVLPILTAFALRILQVWSLISQFSKALFGGKQDAKKSATSTAKQAGAVDELGDAYKKAGDKAKEAKKGVAGFDEVNELPEPSAAKADKDADDAGLAGLDGGLSGMPEMGTATDLDAITARAQAAADKVKAAWASLTAFLSEKKDIIISVMSGIGAALGMAWVIANWSNITKAANAVFAVIRLVFAGISSFAGLAVLAVGALVGAFVYFYRTNEGFKNVVDNILKSIGQYLVWLWTDIFIPFGKWVAGNFVVAWDLVSKAAMWFWKNVLIPLGNYALVFYNSVISPLAKLLGEVLSLAFDKVSAIAKSFWLNVMVPLGNFFNAVFGPAVEAISAVMSFFWKYVVVPLAQLVGGLFLKVWEGIVDILQKLWELMKPFANWVGDIFAAVFESAFKTVGENIKKTQDFFVKLLNFITQTFTGDWENSWEAIKGVFVNVFNSLFDAAKTPLNGIIDLINNVVEGINSVMSFKLPDIPGLPGGGKTVGITVPKLPKLAKGGITNGEMAAVIGDNPGGREVVSPLNDLLGMIQTAVATAIMTQSQLGNNNQTKQPDIVFQVDGQTFARITNPYSAKETTRIGGSMIKAT